MRKLLCAATLLAATGGLSLPTFADNHPFHLLNVIQLDELFGYPAGGEIDATFDPAAGPPPNLAVYRAAPRIGTNPAVVATDGVRAWVGGYYNGANYFGGTTDQQRATWYSSLGIAEVLNIETTSGFGNPYVRYLGAYHFGPGITNGDAFTGLAYDDGTQTLYATLDETQDYNPLVLPAGADPQESTYVAAIDANPGSATYGQFKAGWPVREPVSGVASPATLTRFHGGVNVDPLDPSRIFTLTQGSGRVYSYNDLVPGGPVNNVVVFQCSSSSYRRFDLDPISGDMYIRTENNVQKVFRNLASGITPFAVASTAALVGWTDAGAPPCNGDVDGMPRGNGQGQGIAFISAANLAGWTDDLVIANSRAGTGSNRPYDVRFFKASDGSPVAQLDLPCEPAASATTGTRIMDFDYHSPTGTLAVLSWETRKLYIYKANLAVPPPGEPVYRDFDYTRNGRTSLADFAGFQTCYTGSENTGGLSLNCQRMNSDLDCDIDFVDFQEFVSVYNISGGP